jgi:hypothetical protein
MSRTAPCARQGISKLQLLSLVLVTCQLEYGGYEGIRCTYEFPVLQREHVNNGSQVGDDGELTNNMRPSDTWREESLTVVGDGCQRQGQE